MRYLITADYSATGAAGVIKDGGTVRQAAIEALVSSVGGSVECCYFGATDAIMTMVVAVPDELALTAVLFTVTASGAVKELSSRALLTAAELDAAMTKSPAFTPPGG